MRLKPVILCGGSGSRLWPLSTKNLPKQFIPMISGNSLLKLTIDRVNDYDSPIFVGSENHRFSLLQEMGSELSKSSSIILEPEGRNTAAAIAAANAMPELDTSTLVLVLPSDHYIPDEVAFKECIGRAIPVAESGSIVAIGITPTSPSSAYGYMQVGSMTGLNALKVLYFKEKPDESKAREYLNSGRYFWNAGIYLARVDVWQTAFDSCARDINVAMKRAMLRASTDGIFVRPDKEIFLSCRSESIDRAVMERVDNLMLIPFDSAWSDMGSWDALTARIKDDELGNRTEGRGLFFECSKTTVIAKQRKVVGVGLKNLLIVETPDIVLVADREKIDSGQPIVDSSRVGEETENNRFNRVARPWGYFQVVDLSERFLVKRLVVLPGAELSLQSHEHRAEHWVVVEGTATITIGNTRSQLQKNQSTFIPVGVRHRLSNFSDTNLEIIEVQSGDLLSEDDITRYEDLYGREES